MKNTPAFESLNLLVPASGKAPLSRFIANARQILSTTKPVNETKPVNGVQDKIDLLKKLGMI